MVRPVANPALGVAKAWAQPLTPASSKIGGQMCSNYRPAGKRGLGFYGAAALDDDEIPSKDIYPGASAPLLYRASNEIPRTFLLGTFGLLPHWAKERAFAKHTYNARAETVADKPSFRGAWHKRQLCIVPADAIYEPNYETGNAVWWRIARTDGLPMSLAGLWERKNWGDDLPSWSFTLLTVNADHDPVMRRFHKPTDEKRTVVVLDGDQIDRWLQAKTEREARELLRPCDPGLLETAEGRLPV